MKNFIMNNYTDNWHKSSDGLKLYYRDYNNAGDQSPVVICMPGLTRNSRDFEEVADYLAPNYRVICFENRGRGNSDWDPNPDNYQPITYVQDVIDFLQKQKFSQVFALGTSLGGLMSILIQATAPNTFAGIILNDIGPEVDDAGLTRIKGYVGKDLPINTWEDAITAVKVVNAPIYPEFNDEDWDKFTRKLYVEKDGKPFANYDPAISVNVNKTDETSTAPDLWPVFATLYQTPMLLIRGGTSDVGFLLPRQMEDPEPA